MAIATDGALKIAISKMKEETESTFSIYLEDQQNNGAAPTKEEAEEVIDKEIDRCINLYSPLNATSEQKEQLLEQMRDYKEELLASLASIKPEQKSTNRVDTESLPSGEGATSSATPTSGSDIEEESNNSVIFDSMFGRLGKRNAFTVHNLNGRRYYSTIDATIFLNGKIVEEVVQLQWTIDENTMPLFGYNSYIWDDIAKGSRIISGAFAINFTIPDYLDLLIDGAEDSSMSFKNEGKVIEKNDHAARWSKGFTIGVGYGSADSVIGEQPCLFLEDVRLKSSGQAFDTQGKQLVEIYQFIAKDWHIQR